MNRLVVSTSPHLRGPESTRGIMLDVLIALIPACAAGVWFFGPRALFVMAVCVAAAVLSELVTRLILRRPMTIGDLSAAVTGLLLAMNLPSTIPLWMAALGSVVAIVVVKQLFGGLGQNFVNPALIGRIVLMTSFASAMTDWTAPYAWRGVDAVSSATPLAVLSGESQDALPTLTQMLIGQRGGCLGETCAIALLLGGVYLVLRGVITPVIPVCYIGTVGLLTWIAGANPLYQMLSGGLLLGAIFMATDYVTSPVTTKGKIIYAVGCGLITTFIRLFGGLPEGVSFSIVIMNIVTPHIDRLTAPKPFGFEKPKKEKQAEEAAK